MRQKGQYEPRRRSDLSHAGRRAHLGGNSLLAEERVQRRLAAILAADVVGYIRLMGADEAGTLEGHPLGTMPSSTHWCRTQFTIPCSRSPSPELPPTSPMHPGAPAGSRYSARPSSPTSTCRATAMGALMPPPLVTGRLARGRVRGHPILPTPIMRRMMLLPRRFMRARGPP